jgi:hypothetical protein
LPAFASVPEVLIRLERPASLTPELRAWINHRLGSGHAALTRSRLGSGDRAVVLRVELRDGSDIEDLLTDLRLLGLRPNLLSEQTV